MERQRIFESIASSSLGDGMIWTCQRLVLRMEPFLVLI